MKTENSATELSRFYDFFIESFHEIDKLSTNKRIKSAQFSKLSNFQSIFFIIFVQIIWVYRMLMQHYYYFFICFLFVFSSIFYDFHENKRKKNLFNQFVNWKLQKKMCKKNVCVCEKFLVFPRKDLDFCVSMQKKKKSLISAYNEKTFSPRDEKTLYP